MTKINPMTVEEHHAMGAELSQIRDRLQTIGIEVSNRYGVTKPYGKNLLRAAHTLDRARSEGDDQFCRDHRAEYVPEAYYPHMRDNPIPTWDGKTENVLAPITVAVDE